MPRSHPERREAADRGAGWFALYSREQTGVAAEQPNSFRFTTRSLGHAVDARASAIYESCARRTIVCSQSGTSAGSWSRTGFKGGVSPLRERDSLVLTGAASRSSNTLSSPCDFPLSASTRGPILRRRPARWASLGWRFVGFPHCVAEGFDGVSREA